MVKYSQFVFFGAASHGKQEWGLQKRMEYVRIDSIKQLAEEVDQTVEAILI